MLSFLGFLNEQKKGDTAATTFFHEVICGIACYDSRGASQIKTGEDIKKFFDDGSSSLSFFLSIVKDGIGPSSFVPNLLSVPF